jgi:hypothetical protein
MYIFKYHPDGQIYINNSYFADYADFIAANPNFPISEGQFLEIRDGAADTIDAEGHHIPANIASFNNILDALFAGVNLPIVEAPEIEEEIIEEE